MKRRKRPSHQRSKKPRLELAALNSIIERASPVKPPEKREPKHYMFDVSLTNRRLDKPEKSERRKRIEARWAKRKREAAAAKGAT